MSWKHIYPLNDKKTHYTGFIDEIHTQSNPSCCCECSPRLDFDKKLVVHFSFDGREVIEWAKETIQCEHNEYTIRNVCNNCGKFLNKEESDRCCNGG